MIKKLTAVRDFYCAPLKESQKRNIAFFFLSIAAIGAATILICYYQKAAHKLFMKEGSIGKLFHNKEAWKAIVVAAAIGVGISLLIHTVVASIFHLTYKKKETLVVWIKIGHDKHNRTIFIPTNGQNTGTWNTPPEGWCEQEINGKRCFLDLGTGRETLREPMTS